MRYFKLYYMNTNGMNSAASIRPAPISDMRLADSAAPTLASTTPALVSATSATSATARFAAFAALGFGFGPWAAFIALMIAAGFLGTVAGRLVLVRISDPGFKRALDVLLILISLRLIWGGLSGG